MSSLFGIEASRAVLFVIAFAIILALVALFGLVLRKLTSSRLMMPGSDRSRSRQPRLGIVDVYDLDRQRQLLLLRRDNVEHLLLIGGPNDVVIETNIVRVAGARLPVAANEASPDRYEPVVEQASRPAPVEANGRPSIEAQLAAQLGAFVRRPSEESDVEQELSPVGSVRAAMPAHVEPVLKPDAVSVSTAPPVQALRAEARVAPFPGTPANAAGPVPPAPAERPEPRPAFTPPPPFQSRPTPTAPTQPAPPPPPSPVETVRTFPAAPAAEKPAAPAAAPDAAVLSNMAKQLEEALKRPAATITLPPAPAFMPPEDEVADDDDLLEDRRDEDKPAAPAEEDRDDLAEEAPAPRPEPPRPAVEPVRPAPSPRPSQKPEPAPAQASRKEPDPFSVEEIEAEFARLLGRPLDSSKRG